MNATEVIQLLEIPTTTVEDAFDVKNKIKSEASVSEMVSALQQSPNADVREILCDLLGELASQQAVPALIESLHDPSAAVRGSAADALGRIGEPTSGEALMERYIQEDDDLRQLLAIALGAAGYRPAIPYLIEALSSPSQWGLKSLNASFASEALQRALEQETDPYAAGVMKKALKAIHQAQRSQKI